MAWVAVDKDGSEWIFEDCPVRKNEEWVVGMRASWIDLLNIPKGTIKKLIGKDMS